MPSPSLSLEILLATVFAAGLHLWWGGDGRSLLFDILASWIGFALGEAAGQILGIASLTLGTVHVLAGAFGALIALTVNRILARRQTSRSRGD